MSGLPSQLTNWLYNVLQPQYQNKQLTYTHICQFLQVHFNKNYRFKVRTGIYTSSITGQTSLLINLYGNLPTKSGTRVPIDIWIPFNYPYGQRLTSSEGVPIVFISPDIENGMRLIPGNNVDSQGRFYHPYLTNWYQDFEVGKDSLLKQYNLLVLLRVLQETFEIELPVFDDRIPSDVLGKHLRQSPADAPAKPPKVTLLTHIPPKPQLTGPPLPQKELPNIFDTAPNFLSNRSSSEWIGNNETPSKYASPLPLPSDLEIRKDINQKVSESVTSYETNNTITHQFRPILDKKSDSNYTEKLKVIDSNNISDLMDKFDVVSIGSSRDNYKMNILKELSEKINSCLSDVEGFKINDTITLINENSVKINALFNQLSHHNIQAKANSENLQTHIDYLSRQLQNLISLNSSLVKLDEINSQEANLVTLSDNISIDINEVIIPDLMLVKQLYETVSEIKAMKDSINLIAGKFRSELEIINNDRVDVCVKTIRSVGREIFWNELVKNELVYSITGLASNQ